MKKNLLKHLTVLIISCMLLTFLGCTQACTTIKGDGGMSTSGGNNITDNSETEKDNNSNNSTTAGEQEIEGLGLVYASSYDNSYYTVTGVGTFKQSSLTIPSLYKGKPVKMIGEEAFRNCTFLNKVDIPDSVSIISSEAFSGCTALKEVVIGDGVTIIENKVFSYCENLTDITVGAGVREIYDEAFRSCKALMNVYYTGTIETWVEILFDNTTCNPISYATNFYIGEEKIKELVIPDTVITINKYVFAKYIGLTSITIPQSVKSIGANAFRECENLTSINYLGTKAQLESVDSTGFAFFLSGATNVVCIDGTVRL